MATLPDLFAGVQTHAGKPLANFAPAELKDRNSASRAGLSAAIKIADAGVLRDVASTLDKPDEALRSSANDPAGSRARSESGFIQRFKETSAVNKGEMIGTLQACAGWAVEMGEGAATVAETLFEAGVSGLGATTDIFSDAYTKKQQADLLARAESMKAAATHLLSDPVGVFKAIDASYEARYAAADALEAAYRSGHGDLSLLSEASRIRAEASTEAAILAAETAATVVGFGAMTKGLRGAKLADRLETAHPLAMALATTERANITRHVVQDLIDAPPPGRGINIKDVNQRIDTELLRRTPGTATGKGVRVEGDWLRQSIIDGVGAPVPEQIAAKLAGRSFASFRGFREAFWKEVAADPELAGQFSRSNQKRMTIGRAPFVPPTEYAGQREKFEIDHSRPLFLGGEVFDIDNLRIMTPRVHGEKSRSERIP